MKVTLLKGCVIGTGKTGEKGETPDLDKTVAMQLLAAGAAAKPDSDEAKQAIKEAKEAEKAAKEQSVD